MPVPQKKCPFFFPGEKIWLLVLHLRRCADFSFRRKKKAFFFWFFTVGRKGAIPQKDEAGFRHPQQKKSVCDKYGPFQKNLEFSYVRRCISPYNDKIWGKVGEIGKIWLPFFRGDQASQSRQSIVNHLPMHQRMRVQAPRRPSEGHCPSRRPACSDLCHIVVTFPPPKFPPFPPMFAQNSPEEAEEYRRRRRLGSTTHHGFQASLEIIFRRRRRRRGVGIHYKSIFLRHWLPHATEKRFHATGRLPRTRENGPKQAF